MKTTTGLYSSYQEALMVHSHLLARAAATMAIAVLGNAAIAGSAQSQEHGGHSLGTVDFQVSCSAAAQREFNRGIALLHHMTYPQAKASFEQAARADARCAMAHWGIAMTLFQPLWPTRPGPEELRRGWAAVERARSLGATTERERLYVDAAAAFFENPESPDYWERIRRWERAMQRVHAAYPRDREAAAFFALSHLAAAPVDTTSRMYSERAAALLLTVYQQNPDHPGAMHYLVHANDVSGRESEYLEITGKYAATAPRNPHALHMPTHIYTRLGRWDEVVDGNVRAAEAALEHPAGDRGQFVWDEYPHAIEYVVYGFLQKGADDEAAAWLTRLRGTERLQPTFKTAFHQASTAARYALERRAWAEAVALIPREPSALAWDRFPWAEAVSWFARGLGGARAGQLDAAREAASRLEALERAASGGGEALFARNIRILRLAVSAWLAHGAHDSASGLRLMREAAALELATPKHPVTPAPTLPAQELLGDMLLEQGRAADALAAYQSSLRLYPRRFNSLLGAARAARASGDENRARAYYRELVDAAGTDGRRPALAEARAAAGPR